VDPAVRARSLHRPAGDEPHPGQLRRGCDQQPAPARGDGEGRPDHRARAEEGSER
jgi:hypothetical protein